ncbi:hypothetical protein [Streptosporangium sp. NPDC000396]|uniref:hypothetical protein n=1 Tax=Streptosporangium sp. NPDC000396 TaxID=3366185 RepID=UPI0036C82503
MTNLLSRPRIPQELRRDPGTVPLGTVHRPLVICSVAMAGLAVLCGLGLMVDGRTLLGEPVWFKPLKFAVSFGMYAATLAWMMHGVQRWRRTLWWLGTVAAAGFLLPEIGVIVFQAARGVPSHFNFTTSLDSTLFAVMGGAAYLGWALTLAMGVFLMFQRRSDRALAWAVPLGILVSLAGMSVGYLMTSPTPAQAEALDRGLRLVTIGAHTVGAPDDGAGMPLTGWSTVAGDLRVAHFVGLHALQALPLLAVGLRLLSRRIAALRDATTRTALVVVAALGYAGLIGILVWQAQRGQSLIGLDARMLTDLLVLAGATSAAALVILLVRAGVSGRSARR